MRMDVDDSRVLMNSQDSFRGGMQGGGRGRSVNHTGPDHHMRPQKGRSEKTLVVEKIPEDNLSLDAVNGWFKRFGTVTNVAIDAHSAKALVTFAEHEDAYKAWKSQDAVFNNRFVKLYWHRPMEGHGQGGARALAASASLVANINGKEQVTPVAPAAPQPASLTVPNTPISVARRKSSTPSVTASALAAKQQLLEQQIAEQKSLMSQLETASATEKKQIMGRLRKLGEEMKSIPSPVISAIPLPATSLTSQKRTGPSSQSNEHERREKERLDKELEGHTAANEASGAAEESTEDLKAKLAKLKAEVCSSTTPLFARFSFMSVVSYRRPVLVFRRQRHHMAQLIDLTEVVAALPGAIIAVLQCGVDTLVPV